MAHASHQASVVVVGSGYGWVDVTRALDDHAQVTLVEPIPGGQQPPADLSLIHEPALRDLSHVDRTFLAAMAVDDGPSRMADIAARLTADANHASQYRLRLIAADMIRPSGHGHVDYTLPYLREHAASTGL